MLTKTPCASPTTHVDEFPRSWYHLNQVIEKGEILFLALISRSDHMGHIADPSIYYN